MLRQLLTFRFLPYRVPSHAIFSTFPDVELSFDGARMFAGENKFKDDVGSAARPPLDSESRGRLAARTVSEYRA